MIRRVYSSATVANADISSDKRYQGLIVPIDIGSGSGGGLQLYWYKNGTTDADLVPYKTDNFKSISSNYTVLYTDETILVNSGSGNVIVTLDPVALTRKTIRVKKITTDGNSVSLQTTTGTIDGFSSISLYSNNEGVVLHSNGTSWYTIAYNGLRPNVKTVTANYTFNVDDQTILCNTAAGNISISINPAYFRRELRIKKISSDSNFVTITPTSGSIDGAANYVLSQQHEAITIQSDGVNLNKIAILKLLTGSRSLVKVSDSDFTITAGNGDITIVYFDPLTADHTVFLPDPALSTERRFTLKHGGAGPFNLLLSANVYENSSTWVTGVGQGQSLSFESDGTKFIIVK